MLLMTIIHNYCRIIMVKEYLILISKGIFNIKQLMVLSVAMTFEGALAN